MKMTGTRFTIAFMTFCIIVGMTLLSIPSPVYAQNIPVTLEQDYQTFTGDVYDGEVPYDLTEDELNRIRDRDNPSFPAGTYIVEAGLTLDGEFIDIRSKINYGQIVSGKQTTITSSNGNEWGFLLNFKKDGNENYFKHELINQDGARSFLGKCRIITRGNEPSPNPNAECFYNNGFISFRGKNACEVGDGQECYKENFNPNAKDGVFTTNEGNTFKIDWQTFDSYGNIIETTRPIENTPIVNNTLNTPISGGFTASPRP